MLKFFNKDEKSIILSSGLFDRSYYLKTYRDVKKANIEPIDHFIKYGAKEGRNPNAFFDTRYFVNRYMKHAKNDINPLIFYKNKNKNKFDSLSSNFDATFYFRENSDVKKGKLDPLYHYLHFGLKEGRKGCESQYDNITSGEGRNSGFLNYQFPRWIDINSRPTGIIVPIFNAYSETKKCIFSLLEHTDLSVDHIVFINDCSTDDRIEGLLRSFSDIKNIKVLTNSKNLGYTKTVNAGIEFFKDMDIVLLNSDTEVTPYWIRNLKLAAFEHDHIGTVTAVSNGAGAFSVPKAGLHELPHNLSASDTARLTQRCGPHERIEVPTGNGFCLFIKRDLINQIGLFDHLLFPRGYGEENYFCMKAIEYGFSNIVDPNTYIFHVRNASFQNEKELLIENGIENVVKEFPEYLSIVKMIGDSRHFKSARAKISKAIANTNSPKLFKQKRILFVISTRTGGTPQTNLDLMRGISSCFSSLAIACNRSEIEVLEATKYGYHKIESFKLGEPIKFSSHRSLEYDNLFKWILFKYGIDLVHVRHLAWQSLNIFSVCKSMGIKTVNSFHDFYTICPTVNLIDNEGNFYSTGVTVPAKNPLWDDCTVNEFSIESNRRWHSKMASSLKLANAHVTTCESAKSLIQNVFPSILSDETNSSFSVFPHGRDFSRFYQYAASPDEGVLKVLLPGNISLAKGAEAIKAIRKLDQQGLIEFHVLGTCSGDLKPYVVYHGAYERNQFAEKVKEIKPHIGAVLSIWPETYCHTLTECWACGLPVLGVNLGAVGDRISKYGGGWVVENDPQQIFDALVKLNSFLWEEQVEKIKEWQNGYGSKNTISNMASKYINLYNKLFVEDLNEIPHDLKKVGLVLKGNFPDVPPTAYVRMVDWKDYFEKYYGGESEFIDGTYIFSLNFSLYKQIVVQRNSIPAEHVESFIQRAQWHNVKLCLEIDDNLFDVPEYIDVNKEYADYKPSLEALISNADEVHVPNAVLSKICERYDTPVKIRPNKILKSRWIDQSFAGGELVHHKEPSDNGLLNIVYFGSRTHREDYCFLIKCVELAIQRGKRIKLYAIGITNDRENTPDFVEFLDPPSPRFDLFVEWFKGQRMRFDLGVAPLMDTSFNRTKSYLKALEYSALELPVFCSAIPTYQELDLTDTVTLLENEVEVWADAFIEFSFQEKSFSQLDSYFIETLLENN